MKRQDFDFDLPSELIAQYPLTHRSDSRLLKYVCSLEEYSHHQFHQLTDHLATGDLLVMNNSKVIPARLYGYKSTGGKIELLVERIEDDDTFIAHIKASKTPKFGMIIHLEQGWCIEVIEKQDDLYRCQANGNVDTMLHQIGHVPLPSYISRAIVPDDLSRYQTIYAAHKGSVAAPTAGLHFDDVLLATLKAKGVHMAYLTLHVGAGTFRPVRVDEIEQHKMHPERFIISDDLCQAVKSTREKGGRVIAVGTTALRSLESAVDKGELMACHRETNLFIYPGYQFQICDGLITNFHLPESTLLMLVAALIGYEQAMQLYRLAIEKKYRFFSYGDANLLLRQ